MFVKIYYNEVYTNISNIEEGIGTRRGKKHELGVGLPEKIQDA